MDYQFPGAYPNQQIRLTFNLEHLIEPGFVLIFAFYNTRLLFTHHKQRGWELPGGICKTDEWPIEAAIRETYEETGAELGSLKTIGQYIMNSPNQPQQTKTIFVAEILKIHPLPSGFETDAIQLRDPPTSEEILANPEFSLLLKDAVYYHSLPVAVSALKQLHQSQNMNNPCDKNRRVAGNIKISRTG